MENKHRAIGYEIEKKIVGDFALYVNLHFDEYTLSLMKEAHNLAIQTVADDCTTISMKSRVLEFLMK